MIPQGSLKGLAIVVFVLFIIYVIMKIRHNTIRKRHDESGRFRFRKPEE